MTTGKDLRLLQSYEVLDCTPQLVQESKEQNGGKIILRGVMQRADALNQNGRIYPREILEREIRNYQKFIIENRAVGECVPPGTEIYTNEGWKKIEDISEKEIIATLNLSNNELQFQRIDHKIILDHKGPMYRFKNTNMDMMLTPNHKLIVWNRSQIPEKITAEELYQSITHGEGRSFNYHDVRCTASELMGKDLNSMSLDYRFLQATVEEYEGKVYCVNVKNGSWLMRYNGKACWTSNCDHPETSVINLKNVSHIVRECKMQSDGTVFGSIELLDTPSGKIIQSLIESGVKIGISSRGVGSVTKDGDHYVVSDDFILVGFDLVSEPSTPQAFMLPEGKQITGRAHLQALSKDDYIDRVLNDILF